MNERSLHVLLGRIVLMALPLAAQAGCGGTTSPGDGLDHDEGSEGEATGGNDGTGGVTGTGGDSVIGVVTGGVPATGGVRGVPECVIPTTGFSMCTAPRRGVIPRSCVSEPFDVRVCDSVCGYMLPSFTCEKLAKDESTVTIQCPPSCVAGRRPPRFVPGASRGSALGAHFARAAELESASVAAFRGLRAELRVLGAPRRLLRSLSRAARDERRHTRAVSALARRFGSRVAPATIGAHAPRSLEEIALENVAEGCVRELYGALVATFQARAAEDSEVRRAMAPIARDEVRHAALSMTLQRWLERRLDGAARGRVARAREAAIAQLAREISVQLDVPRARLAGLPSASEARYLFETLLRS